ncbi:MAG: TonB-dependent receptor [Hydrogenophilaceae bacterium]
MVILPVLAADRSPCLRRAASAGALLAALSAPAGAEEVADLTQLSIEDLLSVEVYSASRFAQKTTEAPAAVSIVTAADIKHYGYRTLADILASLRGLYVTSDRNYQYVGVRGFNRPGDYNSRVLLLVDGIRVNDAVYDTASIGNEFFLDVDLIDRVEVVRGPGSSIYGSNAFFGVVNVITRRGRDYDGLEVAGSAASFGTGAGRLTYGRRFDNGAEALLSASYSDSQGQDLYFPEFDTPENNNGIAQKRDHARYQKFYGKLSYEGFTLTSAWSESIQGVPTASFDSVFNDPRTRTVDTQAVLDLAYDGKLTERLDLSGRVYYGRYFYDGTFPYDAPPVTVNVDQSRAEWWGAEARLVGRFDRHKLVFGAEYQDNFRQGLKNYDLAPYEVYLDEQHDSTRQAFYIQDELPLGERLRLSAGLRYDHFSTVGGTWNPRLALIYAPQPETAIKLLYGTAFRAPNDYELYLNDAGLTSKPSEDLKPEEITSYEIVVEHQFQANYRVSASVYQNEISDLISQVIDPADGLSVFRNTGRVESKGAEFEVERAWADDTRLRASYAWQITRAKDTGAILENSPRHLAKLNYSMPLIGDALRAGLELQYTSSRKTLAGARTGGYGIANLTLSSDKLADGLELSASVYNLFDRHYADPGRPEHVEDLIGQDGRSFRLKAVYRF